MVKAHEIKPRLYGAIQAVIPDPVLIAIRRGDAPLKSWREWRGWSEWHLAGKVVDKHYAEALRTAHIDPMAMQIRSFEEERKEWHRLLPWWADAIELPVFLLQPWFYREVYGV